MGGKLRGLAIRMEGRCAPILANLSLGFKLRLALWEEPDDLSAMAHLYDLRFLLVGYFPASGTTVSSLELLARLRKTETFHGMPCILVVRALEWAAYRREAADPESPGKRILVVHPDIELAPELPALITEFVQPQATPVLEYNLDHGVELNLE
jgi:hypothetical protein